MQLKVLLLFFLSLTAFCDDIKSLAGFLTLHKHLNDVTDYKISNEKLCGKVGDTWYELGDIKTFPKGKRLYHFGGDAQLASWSKNHGVDAAQMKEQRVKWTKTTTGREHVLEGGVYVGECPQNLWSNGQHLMIFTTPQEGKVFDEEELNTPLTGSNPETISNFMDALLKLGISGWKYEPNMTLLVDPVLTTNMHEAGPQDAFGIMEDQLEAQKKQDGQMGWDGQRKRMADTFLYGDEINRFMKPIAQAFPLNTEIVAKLFDRVPISGNERTNSLAQLKPFANQIADSTSLLANEIRREFGADLQIPGCNVIKNVPAALQAIQQK